LGASTTLIHDEVLAEAADDDNRRQQMVEQVLAQLPDQYRIVLEYRFLKQYSIAETAEAMGVSVSNAKVLQHRALKKAAQFDFQSLLSPTV
jgi:RNA polymerase sigma-70 factor (ECF subfamily)